MAMNRTNLENDITDSLKARMFSEWGGEVDGATADSYEPFARMLAEEIAGAVITHIQENAEDSMGGSIT